LSRSLEEAMLWLPSGGIGDVVLRDAAPLPHSLSCAFLFSFAKRQTRELADAKLTSKITKTRPELRSLGRGG